MHPGFDLAALARKVKITAQYVSGEGAFTTRATFLVTAASAPAIARVPVGQREGADNR
jgi:hypothetical protein